MYEWQVVSPNANITRDILLSANLLYWLYESEDGITNDMHIFSYAQFFL